MPPRYRTAGLGQGQTRRPQPADPFPNAQIQAGQALAKQASGLVSAVAGRLEKDARITARTQLAEFQGEAGMKYAEGVRTGDVSTPGFADRMLNWFDERFAEIRGDPEEMSPWDANAFDALAPGVAQMRANLGIQAASAEATEADKSEAFNLQTTMPNALSAGVKSGGVDVSDALGQFDGAIEDVNRPESEKQVWRENGRRKIWDSHYRGEIDRDPGLAVEQLKTEAAIRNLGPDRSATLQSLAKATLARRSKETALALTEALTATDEARREAVEALLSGTPEEQSAAQEVLDQREQQLHAALAGSGLPESEKLKIWNGFIEDRQIEKASLYVRSSETPLLAVKEIFEGTALIGGEDIRKGISSESLDAWRSRMLEEARAAGRAKRAQIKLQEDAADDVFDQNMESFLKKVANDEIPITDGLDWVNDGRLRPSDYRRLSSQDAARTRTKESHEAFVQDRAARLARQEAADVEAAEDKAFDDAYGALLARDVAGGGLDAEEVRDAVMSGEVRPQDGKTLLDILSMKDRQAQQDAVAKLREERAATRFEQAQTDREVAAQYAAGLESANALLLSGDLTAGKLEEMVVAGKVKATAAIGLLDKLDAKDEKQAKEVAEIKEQMAMMAVMTGGITMPEQIFRMGLPAAVNRRLVKQLGQKQESREFDRFLKRLNENQLTNDAVLESQNLSDEQKRWFLSAIEDRDEKQEKDRIDFIVEDTQNRIDEGGVSVEYVMGLDIPPERKQDILKHLDNQLEADENARALEFHQRLTAGEDPVAVRKSLDSAFLGGAITRKQYENVKNHLDSTVEEDQERQGVTIPDARQQAGLYRGNLQNITGAKSPLLGKFQKTESNALRAQVMNHYNEMLVAGVPVKLAYMAGVRMWNKNRWIIHDLAKIGEVQNAVRRRMADQDKVEDISTIPIDAGAVMTDAIAPPAIVITNGLIDVDATRLRMMNQNNDGILSDDQLLEIDSFLKDLP